MPFISERTVNLLSVALCEERSPDAEKLYRSSNVSVYRDRCPPAFFSLQASSLSLSFVSLSLKKVIFTPGGEYPSAPFSLAVLAYVAMMVF